MRWDTAIGGLDGNRRSFTVSYLRWVLAVLYWVGLQELGS